MTSLDQVLNLAMELPSDQQEMLITLLRNRYREQRRQEIAREAKRSLEEFRAGKYQPMTAAEAIVVLQQDFDESET